MSPNAAVCGIDPAVKEVDGNAGITALALMVAVLIRTVMLPAPGLAVTTSGRPSWLKSATSTPCAPEPEALGAAAANAGAALPGAVRLINTVAALWSGDALMRS